MFPGKDRAVCIELLGLLVLFVHLPAASTATCAANGADYTWSESVSGDTRTISINGCPNHPTANLNPNFAVLQSTTYTVPAVPKYSASQEISLAAVGGAVGVTYDGGQIYSAFAGPTYPLSGYLTSAPYLEGNTFDACGGHSSSNSKASYHYHVPPSCLLAQLGMTSGAHSPQIGWIADGFPVYGPLGPNGTTMRTCTVTGGTVGSDVCTDACGGYAGDTGDGFTYRYYIMGAYNDGRCSEMPAQTPGGGTDYYPFTPVCLRGCCPSGASCSVGSVSLKACSGSSSGTASSFNAGATRAALAVNSQASSAASYAAAAESTLCCNSAYITSNSQSPEPTMACSNLGACAASATCTYTSGSTGSSPSPSIMTNGAGLTGLGGIVGSVIVIVISQWHQRPGRLDC